MKIEIILTLLSGHKFWIRKNKKNHLIEIDLVRFISISEVQATAEAPTEEVTEEIVAEDNGRA